MRKRFEYAVFPLMVPYADIRHWSNWPNPEIQKLLLERLNYLGSEGWEVIEWTKASITIDDIPEPGVLFPWNIWAKREVARTDNRELPDDKEGE